MDSYQPKYKMSERMWYSNLKDSALLKELYLLFQKQYHYSPEPITMKGNLPCYTEYDYNAI